MSTDVHVTQNMGNPVQERDSLIIHSLMLCMHMNQSQKSRYLMIVFSNPCR